MKIIIIGQSSGLRSIVANEILQGNFEVDTADSLEAGLTLLYDTVYNLVILDIELSGNQDLEIIQEFRQLEKEILDNYQSALPLIAYHSDPLNSKDKFFQTAYGFGADCLINKNKCGDGHFLIATRNLLNSLKPFLDSLALVIMENVHERKSIVKNLEGKGFNTIIASNDKDSLKKISDNLDTIEMIILSTKINTPDFENYIFELNRLLEDSDIPVLLLVTKRCISQLNDLFPSGLSGLIVRPVNYSVFSARVSIQMKNYIEKKCLRLNLNKQIENNLLKNRLIALSAHDFNSPINSILELTKLLQDETESNSERKKYPKIIHDIGVNLLDLSKHLSTIKNCGVDQDYSMNKLDLDKIIKDIILSMIGLAKSKDIVLKYDTSVRDELPTVGNALALRRVFTNLISNAIKFSKRDNEILVKVNCIGKNITIDIVDYGIGISDHDKKIIFDPYTKASKKGTEGEVSTGLGLSIVKSIITQHRGTIKVESTPNKSTVFSIRLLKSS